MENDDNYIENSQEIKGGLKLGDLLEGTTFELEENESNIKDESLWWSKEEMIKYLDNIEDILTPFDEKLKKMTHISNNVFKLIISPGIGPVINESNSIIYHYNAYLEGLDDPFDSSLLRGKPNMTRLQSDGIVPGLLIGLLTMRKGEKAEILVPPELAYGKLGCLPRIPGDATILFVVEILKVFEEGTILNYMYMTPEERAQLPFEKILDICDKERISGNTYFKDSRFKDAAIRYNRAICFLERHFYKDKSEEYEANKILGKLYPNLANSYLKLKKLPAAMTCCKKALRFDSHNIKALYHYGRAKYMNGEYDEAKKYFLQVNELKPGDKSLIEALRKLEHKVYINSLDERDLYTKMSKSLVLN